MTDFWAHKQPLARMKHKILSEYLTVWAAKLGSSNSRIVFVDGFAGPGRYEDGDTGSPLIAMNIASDPRNYGKLTNIFVEKNKSDAAQLQTIVTARKIPNQFVLASAFEVAYGEILRLRDNSPALVYIDPYGSAVPFSQIVGLLNHSRTEILLNLSIIAISRIGGLLRTAAAHEAALSRLDSVLGRWWRDTFQAALSRDPFQDSTAAAEAVADEYCTQVHNATKVSVISADLTRRIGHKPLFQFTLFGKHSDANIVFYEAASRGIDEWLRAVYRLEAESGTSNGQLGFWSDQSQIDQIVNSQFDSRQSELQRVLTDHLRKMLIAGHTLAPTEYHKTFGPTMGEAREKHLRKAWATLAQEKIANDVPRGKLWNAKIVPVPAPR